MMGAFRDDLDDAWETVLSVWQQSILGLTIGHFLTSIAVIVAAVLIRRLFARVVLSRLHKWTLRRHGPDFNSSIIEALAPPLQFVPITLAVFIIAKFVLSNPLFRDGIGQLGRSLVAFTIFWSLFAVAAPFCTLLDGRTPLFSKAMIGWTVRVAHVIIAALGASAILEIWGIHVGPILASFGLVGVAVALGAQNLFKNLISGIFIIGERRFQNGDWILAEGIVEGTVETIGLRMTKVRRFDLAPVFVPNSYLADNAVTNFSQMTYRRISWTIGLQYNTTIEQLRLIRDNIASHIADSSDFVQPPEAVSFVRLDKLDDSSIDIMVYCFTRTTVWGVLSR